MKTQTRSQIIEIINKNFKVRPVDLARELKITPQALHRHLKKLVQEGVLSAIGEPPFTQYAPADVPDFSAALNWFKTGKSQAGAEDFICETRDVFSGRLSCLKNLVQAGLRPGELPLLVAVAGEIGNNSFDHNLGHWRDRPGCWFESQTTRTRAWVFIADRGQGILKSLRRADPSLRDDQEALESAFERRISGRSPEKRGNGLKFVKKSVVEADGRGLACFSGSGKLSFGVHGDVCVDMLKSALKSAEGTVTLLSWRLG